MDKNLLDKIESFIIRAKRETYVGGGKASLPYRPQSHDLQFHEDNFSYLDSYFGGIDFLGQEVVYYKKQPVWVMNYYGRIIEPSLITAQEAGEIIKESLSKLYSEERFLGGFQYESQNGTYIDTNEGEFTTFSGKEWIVRGKVKAYELIYHGGLVKE